MKVKQLVTLISVRQYNLIFLIFFHCFSSQSSEKKNDVKNFIVKDKAIARYGREVIFESMLTKYHDQLKKLSCLEKNSLLFQFISLDATAISKKLELGKKNKNLEEFIVLIKAISFSNDFNSLSSDKRLEKDLSQCGLPSYDLWSHTLKEIISFEIYLRDRFLSKNQKINQGLKKNISSFKSSVMQRDNHEWLIP